VLFCRNAKLLRQLDFLDHVLTLYCYMHVQDIPSGHAICKYEKLASGIVVNDLKFTFPHLYGLRKWPIYWLSRSLLFPVLFQLH